MKKWLYFYRYADDRTTLCKLLHAKNFSQAVIDAATICQFLGATLVGVVPARFLSDKARYAYEFKL